MKPLKIVIIASILFFAVYYYVDNYIASHPMMGAWKSDKELSMQEYYSAGVTAEQEQLLLGTLGEKTLRVTKDQWMSSERGKNEIHSYRFTAEESGCYSVKKLQKAPMTVCVHDDKLFLPGIVDGAREVFVKR